MRIIKSEFEKNRDKNIRAIKKSIDTLRAKQGYIIEAESVETMYGAVRTHIYIRGRDNKNRIYEQKYLFTLNEVKTKEE